jgi:exodeoxyribonuclease V alpha subunit
VLCPMHRGPAGAEVLNERLQAALTPPREGLLSGGSVGVITALSLEDQELRVLLDEDEEVAYGFDELDELTHAYTAVTRAKRMVALVGSRRTLAKAVRTQGAGRRHTALTERLRPGPMDRGRRDGLSPASTVAPRRCSRVGDRLQHSRGTGRQQTG